jgi:ABC-type transporter Mla MlaB component
MVLPLRLTLDESVPADLGTVDTLARMQLLARRYGCELVLGELPDDLRALLALVGLSEALRVEP